MERKRNYFSFSQINNFLTCPLKYKYKYIDGIEITPSKPMLEGSKAHKNIAEILKNKEIEGLPEKIKFIIERYFYDSDEMCIEQEINIELSFMDIKLIPDIYAKKGSFIYLIDWKRNIIPENDMQLKFYMMNLKNIYPDAENFVAWFYALETNFFKRFFYTREDLNEFEDYILDLLDKIENEKDFKPIIGSHCGWCEYCSICMKNNEINLETVNNLIIDTDEKFKKVAEKVLLYEAVLSKIKEILKNYMIETGQNEIQIVDNDKFYLSFSTILRSGKIRKKNGKNKKS